MNIANAHLLGLSSADRIDCAEATLEYEVELLKVVDMDPDVDEFDEDIEIPKDLDKMGKNDLGEGAGKVSNYP